MITIGVLMGSAYADDSVHVMNSLCRLSKERWDVNLLFFPGIESRDLCTRRAGGACCEDTQSLVDAFIIVGQKLLGMLLDQPKGSIFADLLEHTPYVLLKDDQDDVKQAFAQACALAADTGGTDKRRMERKERKDNFERALEFAMRAHKGQVRKGSTVPYIVHPIETALIAMTLTRDQDIMIAALFHDIIEDTPYGAGDIEAAFGSRIARLVQSNSENKRKGQNASDTWKIRKQEFIDSLDQKTKEEKMIALADKLSNMRATYQGSRKHKEDFWLRFNEKRKEMHHWYYRTVAEKLREFEDTEAWIELDHLIRKVYENDG